MMLIFTGSYPTSKNYHNNNNNNNTVTKADVFEKSKRPDDDEAMTSSRDGPVTVHGAVDDDILDDCEPLIIDVRSPGSMANNSGGSIAEMVDRSPHANEISPPLSNLSETLSQDEDMRITPIRYVLASRLVTAMYCLLLGCLKRYLS